MKGPSPGAAKWRISGVGKKKKGKKKRRKIIDVGGKEWDRETDSEEGGERYEDEKSRQRSLHR